MTFTKLHYLPPIRIFLRNIGIVLGSGGRCRKGFAWNLESFLFPIFIGVAKSRVPAMSFYTDFIQILSRLYPDLKKLY
jgi:hypothetical protein